MRRTLFVPSRFLAGKLGEIGCPSEKLHVVPCGVDVSRFQPTVREVGRTVAVGRLVEKKAPQLTIEAFALIAHRFPEARLDMIGDGPLRQRCAALIDRLKLGNRVTLHGAQTSERVAALMQKASLFVQHSVTAATGDVESFGVSLVEAMAAAVPVVATRHNGFVDTVAHGVTGLLVAEHDVDGMADAMAQVLADPIRAATMGAAGRRRVLDHFTQDQSHDRLRVIMGLPVGSSVRRARA